MATRRNNTSGMTGVSRKGNKYVAQISIDGKPRYLGLFSDPREAQKAYLKAKSRRPKGGSIGVQR